MQGKKPFDGNLRCNVCCFETVAQIKTSCSANIDLGKNFGTIAENNCTPFGFVRHKPFCKLLFTGISCALSAKERKSAVCCSYRANVQATRLFRTPKPRGNNAVGWGKAHGNLPHAPCNNAIRNVFLAK